MPALDECHAQVVSALQKAGWIVHPRQRRRKIGRRVIYIDIVAALPDGQRYIEVKCFPRPTEIQEQYSALGQYLVYRTMLALLNDPAPLYLAVSSTIYEDYFDEVMRQVIRVNHVKLLVFDARMEEVQEW